MRIMTAKTTERNNNPKMQEPMCVGACIKVNILCLILRFIILHWVSTEIGLRTAMRKKKATVFFVLNAVFSSCLFKAPHLNIQSALIG